MRKESDLGPDPDMRDEYDFSKATRGKHADYHRAGLRMVTLDPEVAAAFPDAESVNRALRELVAARKSNSNQ